MHTLTRTWAPESTKVLKARIVGAALVKLWRRSLKSDEHKGWALTTSELPDFFYQSLQAL